MVAVGLGELKQFLFRVAVGAVGIILGHPEPGHHRPARRDGVEDEELAVRAVVGVEREPQQPFLVVLAPDHVPEVEKDFRFLGVRPVREDADAAVLLDDEHPVRAVAGVGELDGARELQVGERLLDSQGGLRVRRTHEARRVHRNELVHGRARCRGRLLAFVPVCRGFRSRDRQRDPQTQEGGGPRHENSSS